MKMRCENRLNNIYKILSSKKLDGLLISKQVNVAYAAEMSVQIEAFLVVSPRVNYYITDFRYLEEARCTVSDSFKIIELKGSLSGILKRIAKKNKIRKLGFEKTLTYGRYKKLKERVSYLKLIETSNLIEELRQIKDVAELSKIKQAVSITSKAWKEFLKYLRSGPDLSRLTEKRMADKLEFLLRKQGAVKSAFDIIAACGANISRPHAVPGQTRLKKSQPVLFDFGAVYQDYQSDVTRNFLINKPLGKYQKIYRVVQQAQALAIKAVKPGVRIGLIDNISRSYIVDKGFGKYFGHALGHGIGLEVHEGPVITGKNKNRLVPGMVFSIEPGIYIPGWGGVRIEDMVLVTEKGSEVLTNGIDESV